MFKEKLNQIRVILGLEVKLASDKLVDGTSIEAESFEPGFPLFVVAEDGTKTPAPMGTHETESGLLIEVDAEGKIISSETKTEEVADAPEGEVAVAAAAEDAIPASETPAEIAKKEAAVTEAMKKVVMALESMATEMATMKAKMAEMESNYARFSKTPGADKAPKVTRGEFASQTDSLDARIEALNNLKSEGFFKKNV
jgi:hypothetical protein